MLLAYTLSMPHAPSWNGRWSGEELPHIVVRAYLSKKRTEQADRILADGPYRYNFGDGWVAGISVEEVDSQEAAKMRRKSTGLCGYEWTIDTIEKYGVPLATHEIPECTEMPRRCGKPKEPG